MKKILSSILFLSIVGCAPSVVPSTSSSPTNNNQAVPANGLITYLSFNGDLKDSSGNNVNVTAENGANPTTDKNGKDNQAYNFDGEDDFLKVDLDTNVSKYNKLTMTAWAKSAEDGTEGIRTIISGDDGDYDRTLNVDNRGEIKGWSAFAGTCGVVGGATVTPGVWTFIAAVYDQENKTFDLFVNDKKVSKTECEIGNSVNTFLNIGKNPGFGEYFKGSIDEVRIYNRKLSDQEINTIYKSY